MKKTRRKRLVKPFISLIIFLALFSSQALVISAQIREPMHKYYIIDDEKQIPIQRPYVVKDVIDYLGEEHAYLNDAQDLFLDNQGILYVVDTGNSRVLKVDKEGRVIDVFTNDMEKPLNGPRGIYVDDDGDMYIADTGNRRIVHLTREGYFVEEFTKPQSSLLGVDFTFDVSKIYINPIGTIYAVKGHTLMKIDPNNEFSGYIMSEKLPFKFTEFLAKLVASREQKKRMVDRIPAPISNIVIDEDGMVYAVTVNSLANQIKKINSLGANIYKADIYGETVVDEETKLLKQPYFIDIAVDKHGIISVLEGNTRKIYQYDQEGNLLAVFGGKGNWKGVFVEPTSLVVDDNGRIYVLDGKNNNIQIFEPTRFISTVHMAVGYYYDGRYVEAMEYWEEVLQMNENYGLAHKGMGKALFKQKKYKEAMEAYYRANEREGHSESFGKNRHIYFRKYFFPIIACIVATVIIIFYIVKKLRQITGDFYYE